MFEPESFKAILADALRLPESERETFVRGQLSGSQAERMLALLNARAGEEAPFREIWGLLSSVSESDRVGDYRVIRRLGDGGAATVYLAERADGQFEKQVAIKVFHPIVAAGEMEARLRLEQQILAQLEHPNIARLLDVGLMPGGRPYLVMEYVDGRPITEFCKSERLSIEERIRLFQAACNGVAYSHQALVVHRDLKPAHILVTKDRTVKLIDFGISKVLKGGLAVTTAGVQPLTAAYASPEQVTGGRIGTGTDIYSLCVICYEMLTGSLPYNHEAGSTADLIRKIADGNLRAARMLDGDLQAILMKGLRRDGSGRYRTADELSEDLGRFLQGRPVLARRGGALYAAQKFALRNRWALLSALMAAGLVFSTSMTAWQESRRAERRYRAIRELSDSVMYELENKLYGAPKSLGAVEYLARTRVEYLEVLLTEKRDREVEMRLIRALLSFSERCSDPVESNIGHTEEAMPACERSVRLARERLARNDALGELDRARNELLLVEALLGLGKVQWEAGRDLEAELTLSEAERVSSRYGLGVHVALTEFIELHPKVLGYRGIVQVGAGRTDDGIRRTEEGVARARELWQGARNMRSSIGNAEQTTAEVWAERRRRRALSHALWIHTQALLAARRPKLAVAVVEEALAIEEELIRIDSLNFSTRSMLGRLLALRARTNRLNGRNAGALRDARAAAKWLRGITAEEDGSRRYRRDLASALREEGLALATLGLRSEALAVLREERGWLESVAKRDHMSALARKEFDACQREITRLEAGLSR
jgi:non-specific serine/threonine protein kinase/serine/threonine-protein kinase